MKRNNCIPVSIDDHEIEFCWPHVSAKSPAARQLFAASPQPAGVRYLMSVLEQEKGLVPKAVIAAVNQYRNSQIPLLALAGANSSLFSTLHNQSPALCYNLSLARWLNPKFDVGHVANHRALWDSFYQQRSRSFARQMSRIGAADLEPETVPILSARWSNSKSFRQRLRHAPAINRPVLQCLLSLPDEALLPNLIRLAAEQPSETHPDEKIFQLWRCWQMTSPDKPFAFSSSVRTVEQLERACQRLERKLYDDEFFYEERFQANFPAPPVPGNDEIVPVGNPRDLSVLARSYRNCLRLYAIRIYLQHSYVYEVPSKEVLVLVEKVNGNWCISAMEGPQNVPASPTEREFVMSWWSEVCS